MDSAHQQAMFCGHGQKRSIADMLLHANTLPYNLYTFTQFLFFLFRIYAFVPSMMKNDQECFLTVVLPLTKSSLLNFLTFGTTVSGFSNEFCRSAMCT
jgi:hypothetical protein